ncbi:hypothetical protein V0R50_23220 [Pseudomonas sp. 148P]|uniref:Uncharacterized protein n=1 Tax=Pseudomonas ulcerans TaxID=3115852 RepID=A0ABU7HXB2_9PSED|nr:MULTISPECIES: hypothetical protein [unclassified Pseudomonas]MEE1924737.1 hypothetical protein [Pseudomonas sp. 147P]MEE1936146.1 hypothetical protein [Pseudomonas sp. 148P]
MARTYRRQGCQYDYLFVLWDIEPELLTSRCLAVRKRLARFHGDSFASHRETPPRRFRKATDRKIRAANLAVLARWLKSQDFDLLFCDVRRCPAWLPL